MYNTWHTTSKDGDECVAYDDKGGVQWVSVLFPPSYPSLVFFVLYALRKKL